MESTQKQNESSSKNHDVELVPMNDAVVVDDYGTDEDSNSDENKDEEFNLKKYVPDFVKSMWNEHPILIICLGTISVTLLVCMDYIWPSYYCLNEKLPAASYVASPAATTATMSSFMWLVVDSLPSEVAINDLIPLIQADTDLVGTNIILDREENVQYSTELQPMISSGGLNGESAHIKTFFSEFPRPVTMVCQIEELNKPETWFGAVDSYVKYNMHRWSVEDINNPILNEGVTKAIDIIDNNPGEGVFLYEIRFDALGHVYQKPGDVAYDSTIRDIKIAIKRMANFIKTHPDTLIIVSSDHGVADVGCNGCTGMHGIVEAGNSAFMSIFASKNHPQYASLPWIKPKTVEERKKFNKGIYFKAPSVNSGQDVFEEPSPPFDLVMRTIDVANTLTTFFQSTPYLKEAIGIPFGPNVGMNGLADETATNMCKLLQARATEVQKMFKKNNHITDYMKRMDKKGNMCSTPDLSRVHGTELSTLLEKHWCTRNMDESVFTTIPSLIWAIMAILLYYFLPYKMSFNCKNSDNENDSNSNNNNSWLVVLRRHLFILFALVEGILEFSMGGRELPLGNIYWRLYAFLPFACIAIFTDFWTEISEYISFTKMVSDEGKNGDADENANENVDVDLDADENGNVVVVAGSEEPQGVAHFNAASPNDEDNLVTNSTLSSRLESMGWLILTIIIMVVPRRQKDGLFGAIMSLPSGVGFNSVVFFVQLPCNFWLIFDSMSKFRGNPGSDIWWQRSDDDDEILLPFGLGKYNKSHLLTSFLSSSFLASTTTYSLFYYQGDTERASEPPTEAFWYLSIFFSLIFTFITLIVRWEKFPPGIAPAACLQFGIFLAASYSSAFYAATFGTITIIIVRQWILQYNIRDEDVNIPVSLMVAPFTVYLLLAPLANGQLMTVNRVEYAQATQTWSAAWGLTEIMAFTICSHTLSGILAMSICAVEIDIRRPKFEVDKSKLGKVGNVTGYIYHFAIALTCVIIGLLFALFYVPWSKFHLFHPKHNSQMGMALTSLRLMILMGFCALFKMLRRITQTPKYFEKLFNYEGEREFFHWGPLNDIINNDKNKEKEDQKNKEELENLVIIGECA